MLFRSPQCLYASVARWPQQGLAAVHPWRCMRCICVRKILFVDDRMYLAFRSLDNVNMIEYERGWANDLWIHMSENTPSKSFIFFDSFLFSLLVAASPKRKCQTFSDWLGLRGIPGGLSSWFSPADAVGYTVTTIKTFFKENENVEYKLSLKKNKMYGKVWQCQFLSRFSFFRGL